MVDLATLPRPRVVVVGTRFYCWRGIRLGSKDKTQMTARDKYRQAVAETLTGWRLGIPPQRSGGPEFTIAQDAIREIIRLRLWIAYMPLLQGLERIEKRVGILCDIRADPYAPPTRRD